MVAIAIQLDRNTLAFGNIEAIADVAVEFAFAGMQRNAIAYDPVIHTIMVLQSIFHFERLVLVEGIQITS